TSDTAFRPPHFGQLSLRGGRRPSGRTVRRLGREAAVRTADAVLRLRKALLRTGSVRSGRRKRHHRTGGGVLPRRLLRLRMPRRIPAPRRAVLPGPLCGAGRTALPALAARKTIPD